MTSLNNYTQAPTTDDWRTDMFQPIQSILPYANFAIYNATYHDPVSGCECTKCDTGGAFVTGEMQGDGYMTGWVETLESCNDCIDSEKCPGCMQPLALSFDLSAFGETYIGIQRLNWQGQNELYYLQTFDYEDAISAMPFEGFTCLVCGWSFDPEKLNADGDPNDYEYYDDWVENNPDNYPALDASDYFPF